jgi:hypothetical protein
LLPRINNVVIFVKNGTAFADKVSSQRLPFQPRSVIPARFQSSFVVRERQSVFIQTVLRTIHGRNSLLMSGAVNGFMETAALIWCNAMAWQRM